MAVPATTKRKKVTLIEDVTQAKAIESLRLYKKAIDYHEKMLSEIDTKILKVQADYKDQIAECQEIQAEHFAILQSYAVNNRDAFGDKKSMELPDGKIGFRTGTPALKTLKGHTWESATTLIKKHLKSYIKITITPLKDKLLAERDNPKINKFFERCGIEVARGETFFIEPKEGELSQC